MCMHRVSEDVGIAGNGAVDARTKEAAQGAPSPLHPRKQGGGSSGGDQRFQCLPARGVDQAPTTPPPRLALFDASKSSGAIARAYSNLSRPQHSVWTSCRPQRVPVPLRPRPDCPLCLGPENISHFRLSSLPPLTHRSHQATRHRTNLPPSPPLLEAGLKASSRLRP
ncbi:hypothetical protein B0H12DRAFT_1237862 [Mycena haematopus]|nr:hypothetical protein B0H12DRAFT_1237862 [Mycena haematopus]